MATLGNAVQSGSTGGDVAAINVPANGSRRDIVNRVFPADITRPHLLIFSVAILLSLGIAIECKSIAHLPSLLYGGIYWVWWGLIVSTLWRAGTRNYGIFRLSPKTILLHSISALTLGTLHLLLLGALSPLEQIVHLERSLPGGVTSLLRFNRLGMEILLYIGSCAIVSATLAHSRSQQEALKSVDLERQLTAAKLRVLQSQMEPHFLFNTLNTITSLVDLKRNVEASEMLSHLESLLRRSLQKQSPEKVPISEELEVVDGYLAIQKARFSDRLQVRINASEEALMGLVPGFLLQPIIENAVNHGIAPLRDGGSIEASIYRVDDRLCMTVRDSGDGTPSATGGHGIGLGSTRERLAHFYPGAHRFIAGPAPTGGYEVTIEIPYEVCAA